MAVALVTGSAGLIGAEAARFFVARGLEVIGIDNDMRRYFFGDEASTAWSQRQLERLASYRHVATDIRDEAAMAGIFSRYGRDISVVVHAAAQPSHDWAAREPMTDFSINAGGTLNLLEMTRRHCPEAVFIFTSTNKVYGDTPNRLPLVEEASRWEVLSDHPYSAHGIDETMSIDGTLHSLFGASKVAADIMVQEYGRYFGMKTVAFRCGCLTGPGHSGTQLHGFLAYLVKCAITGRPYTVFGYGGKQVRDNIHAHDLVNAFWHFFQAPRSGEVYNMGGGRYANCSLLEAITMTERLTNKAMSWTYSESNRTGDHLWWVSDTRKFKAHYPGWQPGYTIERLIGEIHAGLAERLAADAS